MKSKIDGIKLHKAKIVWSVYTVFAFVLSIFLFFKMEDAKHYEYKLNEFSIYEESGAVFEDQVIRINEASGFNGRFVESPVVTLNKGNYTLEIEYETTYPKNILVQASNATTFETELPAGQNKIEIPVELKAETTSCRVKFDYNNGGDYEIRRVTWRSDKMLYSDAAYYLVLLWLLSLTLILLYKNRKKIGIKKEHIIICLLLGISILTVSLPYFEPGLRFTCDIRVHLLRIEGIKEGILEKQFPIVINPNFNNEYGQIATLYPGVPLYIPAVLRLLNVSPVGVYKTFMLLTNILAVVIMYFSVKYIADSKKAATIASILYCFDYFRLGVMNHGGQALGMGIAMVFIPLVLAGMYDIIYKEGKKWYLLSIGIVAITASHILTTIFVMILVLVISIVFVKRILKGKRLLLLLKAAVLVLLLSSGIITAFLFGFRMKLNLQELIINDFLDTTIPVSEILTNPNSMTVFICFVLVMIAFIMKYKERDNMFRFLGVIAMIAFILFISTTELFPWKLLLNSDIVQKATDYIQFAVRFYSLVGPILAMVIGIGMVRYHCFDRQKTMFAIYALLCCTNLAFSFYQMYSLVPEFTSPITGNINSKNQDDYLPANTEPEYYVNAWPRVSDDQNVILNAYIKQGTRVWLTYTSDIKEAFFEPPLFYYEGYEAAMADGTPLRVEIGDENRVRVYLPAATDAGVTIYYHVPKMLQITSAISFVSFLIGCAFLIFGRKYNILWKKKSKPQI